MAKKKTTTPVSDNETTSLDEFMDASDEVTNDAVPARPARRKRSVFNIFLGVLGELLITAGLIVGGFVVWQLWWTGVIANEEQEVAIQEWYGDTEIPTGIAPSHREDPPEWTYEPGLAEVYGVIRVPSWGLDYEKILQEGTAGPGVLDLGSFGHYENTAQPSQIGNFSIAAHRRMAGDPLNDIDLLEVGDVFVVETADHHFVYRMIDYEIVLPTDVRVVAPDPFLAKEAELAGTTVTEPATRRLMTITTCHPRYGNTHRYVVHAELDYWTYRSEGLPIDLILEEERPENWEEIY
ncbi:MAG: class E sortase [Actinomycetaceae bacterium]|nr:class E sortase [Actinomycetaceae bacterium]